MQIDIDDLSRPPVHTLLKEHLANMYELSLPEQVFALDIKSCMFLVSLSGRYGTKKLYLAAAH